jgi:hypothetical protein
VNPNPFNGIEKDLREVAWRRKTPVNTGSGSLEALKRIAGRVQLGEEALEDVNRTMGFKPLTPLHRFLAYRMVELGVKLPGVVENGALYAVEPSTGAPASSVAPMLHRKATYYTIANSIQWKSPFEIGKFSEM